MSYLVKAGMVALSAGAIGGVAYSGYYHFSKDSFSEKLGVSVLKLAGSDDQTSWAERFKELGVNGQDLKNSIKANKWEDLQSWCNYQSTNKFNKEEDATFQNFKSFCTWKVGDKLEGKISSTKGATEKEWEEAHKKLKAKEKAKLPEDLQEIHALTQGSQDNTVKSKMHEWCTNAYKTMWTGEKDQILENAKDICKTP